jgi:hypothetical protein
VLLFYVVFVDEGSMCGDTEPCINDGTQWLLLSVPIHKKKKGGSTKHASSLGCFALLEGRYIHGLTTPLLFTGPREQVSCVCVSRLTMY